MALQNKLCLLFFLATATVVLGGELCNFDDDDEEWCTYGCCDYECCDASVGLIVGLTITGIIVFSVICAIACCCYRRRAAPGMIIQNNPGPGVVVATSQNTMASPGQPVYPSGAYQPGVHGPAPQPYAMGQQYPPGSQPYGAPAPQPGAAAMAAPPYDQATEGQVKPSFAYQRMQ